MKKNSLAVIIVLSLITPVLADNLMSVPETQAERWYISCFCNASLAASKACKPYEAAIADWIVKYKPDIDCEKERQPSLVNTDGDKR